MEDPVALAVALHTQEQQPDVHQGRNPGGGLLQFSRMGQVGKKAGDFPVLEKIHQAHEDRLHFVVAGHNGQVSDGVHDHRAGAESRWSACGSWPGASPGRRGWAGRHGASRDPCRPRAPDPGRWSACCGGSGPGIPRRPDRGSARPGGRRRRRNKPPGRTCRSRRCRRAGRCCPGNNPGRPACSPGGGCRW